MIWQDQDFSLKGFALSFENPTRRQSEHWESITNFWTISRYKCHVEQERVEEVRKNGNIFLINSSQVTLCFYFEMSRMDLKCIFCYQFSICGEDWLLASTYWPDLTYLDVLHSLGHGDPLDAGLSPQLLHHHPLLLDAWHCSRVWYSCSVRKFINTEPKQTFYL